MHISRFNLLPLSYGIFARIAQDSASPYAHLIMEDHAKLLGLATMYLQNYG